MKRLYSFCLGLVAILSAMLISFLPTKKTVQKQTFASNVIEQKFVDESTKELVSKTPSYITNASSDKTPFDTDAGDYMDGVSITPNADEYGQVIYYSYSLGEAGYTSEFDDNILMWIYLIDVVTFKLEISLQDENFNNLTWSFNSQKLIEMETGWKLIALRLSDKLINQSEAGVNYKTITFKYVSEASETENPDDYKDYETITNDRFSFYHVFTSKNANLIKRSGILYSLAKSFYKISEDFDIVDNVFIGDKIKLESATKVFDFLFVGKRDLNDYLSDGAYYWNLYIRSPSGENKGIDFADSITFLESGFYGINIQLKEDLSIQQDPIILNVNFNIYCDELSLGKFVDGSSYNIKDDEKILIKLKLSETLKDMNNFTVSLSNNKAEIESYYIEDNTLYVYVIGKDDGRVNLEVSADAMSKFNTKTTNFSSTASIKVDYSKGKVDIFVVIVWITFICFSVGIIIYLSISVVKSRKNDVKWYCRMEGGVWMAYFDEFDNSRRKIPYDDIPITRNERGSRGTSKYGRSIKMGKFSTTIISFVVVLNLILSFVCIYFIANRKNRIIYNNIIQVGAGSEVSSAVKTSAFLSSVGVAAGSSCSSEYEFYNTMDSRGAGVVYQIERSSDDASSSSYNKGSIYFVTCYHVVSGFVNLNGRKSVWVMLPTSLKPKAVNVLAYSAHYDIAVLEYVSSDIEGDLAGAVPVKMFDSVYTSYGEKIFAIGNPLSSGLSITEGLVSQVNTEILVGTNNYYTRTLQISAEINPGNSGGGLFNAKGEFIGLVNAKRHQSSSENQVYTVVGMSYAIPSSIVMGVADSLISGNNKPKRVDLGVTFEHDTSLGRGIMPYEYGGEWRQIETYAVVVDSVASGSVSSGKLRYGDRIESIEFTLEGSDTPIRVKMFNKYIFDDYAFRIKAGSVVKVYLDDGKEVSTTYKTITLGSKVTDLD